MIKLAAAFIVALVLGGCAPTTSPGDSGATAPAQVSTCPMGLQRCSRYSGQPGECYDPFRSSCHSGKVCTLGQQLCDKDGLTFCYDSKRQRC